MGKPVYKRRFWTEMEDRFLRIYYPNGDTVRIAAALGRRGLYGSVPVFLAF